MKQGNLTDLTVEPSSHNRDVVKRVLFKKGDIPHVTQVSQALFKPGTLVALHSHPDMYELFVCVSGRGTIQINGLDHDLIPGSFVLCEPGEVHAIANSANETLVLNQMGIVL